MGRQKHNGEMIDIDRILYLGHIFVDADTLETVEQEVDTLHGQIGLIAFPKKRKPTL